MADAEGAGFNGQDRARYCAILEAAKSTGHSPEVAIAQFAHAHAILGGRSVVEAAREYAGRHRVNLPAVPVATAVESFIDDRTKGGGSPRYLADLRSRLQRNFAEAHACKVADLRRASMREWLDRQSGGPRSFNNNFAALRTFLRYCVAREWLPKDSDLLEGIMKRKHSGGRIEI
jgi:hypothetical protein